MHKYQKLDRDGQPINKGFNYSKNREKAIFGLKGILEGIVADSKLNEKEMMFLDIWLYSQEQLGKDSDVIDLLNQIESVLKDGHIAKKDLDELKTHIEDIIEYKELEYNSYEDQVNELIGFITGVAADNNINNEEILSLENWLNENSNICTKFPANIIAKRVNQIIKGNVVTQKEKDDLLDTIKEIIGHKFEETGLAHGLTTEIFEDNIETFSHKGQNICFSGKFVAGNRSTVENVARKLGATIRKNITNDVTTLIMGTIASRDWRFTSHGKKIEKAIELKQKGRKLLILTERTWLKFI